MIDLRYMPTKIRYIFLLFHCFLYKVFLLNKKEKVSITPKTILVVQLAWLGDMVCTTPVFRAIKNKYPDCRVVVIGMDRTKAVLDNHRDVDSFIVWKDNLKYLRNVLKNEKIDLAIIATPGFSSLCLLYLCGINNIVSPYVVGGYSPYEGLLYKLFSKYFSIKKPHFFGKYAPREYLRLLEPIGIFSEDTKKTLYFSNTAKDKINNFLLKNHIIDKDLIIGISPSAGNKIKNWPAERFSLVADYLIEKYRAKIIVIGSESDRVEVEEMIFKVKNKDNLIDSRGFSVDELKALISRFNCFISVDTGPIYIAEAFGVVTIDIIGPMDENEQPPRGDKHINVIDPDRQGSIIHIMNSRMYDPIKARRSVENITVEMVTSAFDYLYKKYFENLNFTR